MRTKHIILSVSLAAILFVLPRLSLAQFTSSSVLLGPHIGLSAYGSSPSFGANFETAVTQPGKAGPGIIGISARVDYWSYSFDAFDSYTWITVGVFGNYHFALDSKNWDLFLGLGLGYQNVSWSYSGQFANLASSSYGSGIFFAGDAGARYFFSPGFAARAQIGFGLTFLVLGVDFALN